MGAGRVSRWIVKSEDSKCSCNPSHVSVYEKGREGKSNAILEHLAKTHRREHGKFISLWKVNLEQILTYFLTISFTLWDKNPSRKFLFLFNVPGKMSWSRIQDHHAKLGIYRDCYKLFTRMVSVQHWKNKKKYGDSCKCLLALHTCYQCFLP